MSGTPSNFSNDPGGYAQTFVTFNAFDGKLLTPSGADFFAANPPPVPDLSGLGLGTAATHAAGDFASSVGIAQDPEADAQARVGGYLRLSDTGGGIDTSVNGGSINTGIYGGSINTGGHGGSITTNGNGSPNGNVNGSIGSIYCDQQTPNVSGHVFWIKENGAGTAAGWVGYSPNLPYVSPGGLHWTLAVADDGTLSTRHVATSYNVTLSATNAAGTGTQAFTVTVNR